jgi:hypothetical protein
MDLITTVAEVQSYVAVNSTSTIINLRPYLRLSQRNYLLPVLGSEFFESLVAIYDDADNLVDSIEDEKEKKVIILAQEAIANLGIMHALPILSVQVGANGIQVIKNDQMAPASQWRTEQVFDSLSEVGHQAIDSLLSYLEEETTKFTIWAGDPVYATYQKYFIRSAKEFSGYYNIRESRYLFHIIQYCMQRIEEFEIKKAIGSTLFEKLKTDDKAGELEAEFRTLLNEYLKPAITLFTIAKALQERLIEMKSGSISIRFKGTNTENMYESRPPQKDELESAVSSLKEDARKWIVEAQNYIAENTDPFEALATATVSRKRMNAKNDSPGLTIF